MNKPFDHSLSVGRRATFTVNEYMQMADLAADAGIKLELVQGELERMTPPYSSHGRLQLTVGVLLMTAVADADLFASVETGIDLGSDTVRVPDVVIANAAPEERRLLTVEEVALVVEISDASLGRDLGDKLRDYAAAGIGHYWVVDTSARVVHVMSSPRAGDYSNRSVIRFGEPLSIPGTDRTITLD